ncbi:CU044_5270 family protein [Actinoplanes sp. NPDC051859]|uniref:CU044_5270 family protein n=1 Tax=Actinoplanes sp. NPDC051859 TaxID=3363909 RepID=UPI00379A9518
MPDHNSLEALRQDVPPLTGERLDRAEARFVAALRAENVKSPARTRSASLFWRVGLPTAVAAAVAVAAGVTISREPADRQQAGAGGPAVATPSPTAPSSSAAPRLRLTSAAQVLDRAAKATESEQELDPQPGQFLKYESQTMDRSISGDDVWLYRTKRTLWRSVDNSTGPVLRIEHLAPLPLPGRTVPADGLAEEGQVETMAPHFICGAKPTDYIFNRALPVTPGKMLDHLKHSGYDMGTQKQTVWFNAWELMNESYLPPAQRAAVFRALKSLPGIDVRNDVVDSVGRPGTAVTLVDPKEGVRQELIFDAVTFRYLGGQSVAVDAKKTGVPAGTQVAADAELSVTLTTDTPKPAKPAKCG